MFYDKILLVAGVLIVWVAGGWWVVDIRFGVSVSAALLAVRLF